MKVYADLHIHTTASDGKFKPHYVIERAKDIGLYACAITDHDTIDGLDEAIEAGSSYGIEVIPGIELNTDVPGGEIHILGYFIPYKDKEFANEIVKFKNGRYKRVIEIIDNLKKLGIKIYLEEVLEEAGSAALGRPHIARVLVKRGFVFSFEDAFHRYLEKGKPAYVPHMNRLDPIKAIKFIKSYGGIPVLAHPGLNKLDALIPEFVKAGLMGLEIYHSKHGIDDIKKYFDIANNFDLIITGGSDCHGEYTINGFLMGKYGLDKEDFLKFKFKIEGFYA